MITSVHVANVGPSAALFRAPKPKDVPGLISADGGMTSVLGAEFIPRIQPRRVGMVAFWEDEAAFETFMASHPVAERLAGGWHARLEPLRAYGSWPGLADDVTRSRRVESEGPVVVTTLARLRWRRARQFLTTSAQAEERVNAAPGLIWATGFGSPPFLATLSIWESAEAASEYAYGPGEPQQHSTAIEIDRARSFHREKAFIRYRPIAHAGSVEGGRNPLTAGALAG